MLKSPSSLSYSCCFRATTGWHFTAFSCFAMNSCCIWNFCSAKTVFYSQRLLRCYFTSIETMRTCFRTCLTFIAALVSVPKCSSSASRQPGSSHYSRSFSHWLLCHYEGLISQMTGLVNAINPSSSHFGGVFHRRRHNCSLHFAAIANWVLRKSRGRLMSVWAYSGAFNGLSVLHKWFAGT